MAGCGKSSETPGTSDVAENAATTAGTEAGGTAETAGAADITAADVTAAADDAQSDAAGTDAAGTEAAETAQATVAADPTAAADPGSSLKTPEIEWWELYDPNGFDTFTALVYNPNDVDVDFSYDIVFLKGGKEVGRLEYGYNDCIPAGGQDIIWDNSDIPKHSEVDDIRVENVAVNEAFFPSIGGSFEFEGVREGDAYYNFTFDRQPTLATIWFLLYNDDNGNAVYDSGEIAVMSFTSMTEQTGSVYYETDVIPATNCEVFFKAY